MKDLQWTRGSATWLNYPALVLPGDRHVQAAGRAESLQAGGGILILRDVGGEGALGNYYIHTVFCRIKTILNIAHSFICTSTQLSFLCLCVCVCVQGSGGTDQGLENAWITDAVSVLVLSTHTLGSGQASWVCKLGSRTCTGLRRTLCSV